MSETPKNSFQFVGNWVIDCVDVISDHRDHLESLGMGQGLAGPEIVIIATRDFTVLAPFTCTHHLPEDFLICGLINELRLLNWVTPEYPRGAVPQQDLRHCPANAHLRKRWISCQQLGQAGGLFWLRFFSRRLSRPFLRISRGFGAIAKEVMKEVKTFYCEDVRKMDHKI